MSSNNSNSSGDIFSLLSARLLSLPYDAYLQVITLLLSRLGYQDVCPSGRLDWKGRNKGGGYDLIASLSEGLRPRRVIVSAKQFDKSNRIFQRQVDELRGTAIRAGANEALLITSGIFSPAIDRNALSSPVAPVHLIDGNELIAELVLHDIGIIQIGEGVAQSSAIDEAFFSKLEREAIGNSQSDCVGTTELLLTVSLNRVPKSNRHKTE
jgi:Restriction endonuclease